MTQSMPDPLPMRQASAQSVLAYCRAMQPPPYIDTDMRGYRCTEPKNHHGDHRAVLDGRVLAIWARA